MQRILLVEDNEVNRELIARRLKRRGFDVAIATDGAAGVETATAQVPDLILMDIGLPILDGYEATRLIQENAATRHIPVIGLSAHAMSGDAERAMGAGCDDYDTKPVEWDRLLDKIEKLLAKAAEAAAAARAAAKAAGPRRATRPGRPPRPPGRRKLAAPRHAGLAAQRPGHLLRGRHRLAPGPRAPPEGGFQRRHPRRQASRKSTAGRPLERFRAEPKAADLPILISCSIDAVPDAIDCLDYGADEILPQPFRPQEVQARIERLLRAARRETPPGAARGSGKTRADQSRAPDAGPPARQLAGGAARQPQAAAPPLRRHGGGRLGRPLPRKSPRRRRPAALASLQHIIVTFEDLAKRYGMV